MLHLCVSYRLNQLSLIATPYFISLWKRTISDISGFSSVPVVALSLHTVDIETAALFRLEHTNKYLRHYKIRILSITLKWFKWSYFCGLWRWFLFKVLIIVSFQYNICLAKEIEKKHLSRIFEWNCQIFHNSWFILRDVRLKFTVFYVKLVVERIMFLASHDHYIFIP